MPRPRELRRRIAELRAACDAIGVTARTPAAPRVSDVRPMRRYVETLRAIREARGEVCEACGEWTRYAHHVNPVSATGIASALVWHAANLLLLCDDCHALMHPGVRGYPWLQARRGRLRDLGSM